MKQRDDFAYRKLTAEEAGGADPGATLKLPIIVHPNTESGVIIINYPGYGGDIDGFNGKYRVMAEALQNQVGAVVRMGNHHHDGLNYRLSVVRDLECVIEYALENAEEICGSKTPALYLMGFSAGGSAVAAVAYRYPEVKKILLVAPSGDAGVSVVKTGLNSYRGEAYIVGAENDTVVGSIVASLFFTCLTNAVKEVLEIIPNCDHQFRGKVNGMILSKAPYWAFKGPNGFPSPEGGTVLYE